MLYKTLYILCCLLISLKAAAQDNIHIDVCETKTTHLIFKSAIKYFDFGSQDIGVVNTTEPNIIKMKAAIQHFPETNLTIMTEDNTFYSIIIGYNPNPNNLNFFIEPNKGKIFTSVITEPGVSPAGEEKINTTKNHEASEVELDIRSSELIKSTPRQAFVTGEKKNKIALAVNRIYVDNEMLYFVMDAINETAINYDVDFIKLFIKPKKASTRTSAQEVEITPTHTFNVPVTLKSNPDGLTNFVISVNKFTIANGKRFVMEMWEKNGERSIELEITPKILLGAVPLPSVRK